MRDFTHDRPRIQFKVGEDIFECAPAIPARTLMNFAVKFDSITEKSSGSQQMDAMVSILEAALKPDSLKRFLERMEDNEDPIDLLQVNDIVEWVMGEYGLRPTTSPEPSANGQQLPGDGTNSTASTSGVA